MEDGKRELTIMAIQAIVLQSYEAICFRDAYINRLEKEILGKKRITQVRSLER